MSLEADKTSKPLYRSLDCCHLPDSPCRIDIPGSKTAGLATPQSDLVSLVLTLHPLYNCTLRIAVFSDMVTHMKTTINITDSLLEEAKELIRQEKSTLRALVEEGLHCVISARKERKKFTLRKASFRGNGLQSEFEGESWQKIRSAAYEEHGG